MFKILIELSFWPPLKNEYVSRLQVDVCETVDCTHLYVSYDFSCISIHIKFHLQIRYSQKLTETYSSAN